MFTLYSADIAGNPSNCSYPHRHDITDEAGLKAAMISFWLVMELLSALSPSSRERRVYSAAFQILSGILITSAIIVLKSSGTVDDVDICFIPC